MLLIQHVAAQFGTEVSTIELRRQLAMETIPLRRLPDLDPITDVVGFYRQVLDDVISVSLEPGVRRNGLDQRDRDRLVDRQFLCLATLG